MTTSLRHIQSLTFKTSVCLTSKQILMGSIDFSNSSMPCPQQAHQRHVNIILLCDISSCADKIDCCFLSISLHSSPSLSFSNFSSLFLVVCFNVLGASYWTISTTSEILFHFVFGCPPQGNIISVQVFVKLELC